MSIKTIRIEPTDRGLFFAKYDGGGQLPASLGGVWTNRDELQAKINFYLNNRPPATTAQKQQKRTQTKVEE
jgi:hypothetical protein